MDEIRLAGPADLPAIVEISNHYAAVSPANFAIEPEAFASWERSYRETSERYPWFVAVESGAVTGFAKASPWKGRCAYAHSAEVTVYLRPEHHGRGVGRALYERLISTLDAQGYHTLVGGITLPNAASVALHESFGFRRVALFEQIGWKFDRWHDVGYWQLTLHAGESPQPVRPVREAIACLS